uniref:CKLF like MARVEL transmembrane domain containing 3 n=1 Tax=Sus scrofa TaxID=9823 RepID=A0A8D1K1A3_PIG
MQLNDKWQGLCWPMMDFLRCVTAALIYFAISITAVAKYSDGASKAAGVFGFFATIVFAVDFYLIFNEVAKFLKQGSSADETTANKAEAYHLGLLLQGPALPWGHVASLKQE